MDTSLATELASLVKSENTGPLVKKLISRGKSRKLNQEARGLSRALAWSVKWICKMCNRSVKMYN